MTGPVKKISSGTIPKSFNSISIKGPDFENSISRNKRGDLYFTGISTRYGTPIMKEYRCLSIEEAKTKLYEMITGCKDGYTINVDYKV